MWSSGICGLLPSISFLPGNLMKTRGLARQLEDFSVQASVQKAPFASARGLEDEAANECSGQNVDENNQDRSLVCILFLPDPGCCGLARRVLQKVWVCFRLMEWVTSPTPLYFYPHLKF